LQTTPNLGLKKYETNDTADLTAIGPNWDTLDQEVVKRIVNAGGAPSIQAGPDASKPTPGTAGRLYVATDTQIIYRDTGSAWQKVGVVKWDDIEGKPSSFTPSAHKTTHAIGGSDALSPGDIGAETPAGAQAKAEAAAGAVQSALNSHKAAAAPHSGHETPAGAQAKAEAAAGAVQAELDAHLSEIATQESLGHVKVDGETITASNGIISAQTQIVDTVTSDKWKWGMEDGIVFLEKVVV